MKSVIATRALEGGRRGSSRPIVVETDAGACIVKLRGAAQGTGPLVAEVVVGAIADAIGLSVPGRMLVTLPPNVNIPERDAELRDLMGASIGTNLGFAYLDGARDFVLTEIDKVGAAERAAIFWLDRFVMNPDRNASNTNLLWYKNKLWLIDHGASLGFQYDWSTVTEQSPTRQFVETEPHLFAASLMTSDVAAADSTSAALPVLNVASVPPTSVVFGAIVRSTPPTPVGGAPPLPIPSIPIRDSRVTLAEGPGGTSGCSRWRS